MSNIISHIRRRENPDPGVHALRQYVPERVRVLRERGQRGRRRVLPAIPASLVRRRVRVPDAYDVAGRRVRGAVAAGRPRYGPADRIARRRLARHVRQGGLRRIRGTAAVGRCTRFMRRQRRVAGVCPATAGHRPVVLCRARAERILQGYSDDADDEGSAQDRVPPSARAGRRFQ